MELWMLDGTRLILGTLILIYASYTDIKTRHASNILWVVMGAAGLILLAVQYVVFGIPNIWYLVFIPIIIVLMYALFQMRLIFGGADAKAMMALAVLVPLMPAMNHIPLWPSIMPWSWVIFANSVILFLAIPLSLIVYNASKRNLAMPYAFLGYKMKVEDAKKKFVWPLEKLVDGKRKFSRIPDDFDESSFLKAFEDAGINEIWVTPKVPFMVPLLAGFLAAFFLGDLITAVMQALL
jgi:archaeal preflagellin peptidase FlaK